jgi:predicted DNA-binding transcriptional regulator YafY
MPKSVNQKQKLLFLLDYLRQNTDETHTVTTPQIIDHLAANGIRAERKSIYNDIQTLCDYGYDIIRTEGAHAGYRIADRTFELPEVKLLVDLVQSSKFITTKKSRQLIGKLEQLVSKNDAKKLQRQVVVADRNKTSNEKIYYSVDVIHSAIAKNQQKPPIDMLNQILQMENNHD